MKRVIAIVLSMIFSVGAAVIPCAAYDGGEPPYQLPQIRIVTADGNGTTLQKADGYVDAAVTITDTDGAVMSGSVQFKVRGNTTAMASVQKKAFTFKFSKKQNVLGMGKGKKWALLANAFDPTQLRNYIAINIAQRLGLAFTSEQKFVELWVDDSFRGLYLLIEPVQEGKDRVDIDIESNDGKKDFLIEYERLREEEDVTYFTTNGLRFAMKEPETPDEEQLAYIQGIMDDVIGTIRNGSREEIEAKIDVESFTKYYLLNEFYKTYDFNTSSVYYYYKDGKLYAGPAWDYDLTTGNTLDTYPRGKMTHEPEGICANQQLFAFLCEHEWFQDEIRRAFCDYYLFLADIPAENGVMDELLTTYGDAIRRNFSDAGWPENKAWINIQMKPLATYAENVGFLRSWYQSRCEWLRDYYGVYLVGDTDGDYLLNIMDATLVQRILAGYTPDEDGKMRKRAQSGETFTIMDATAIQRYLVGFQVPEPIGEAALY